jgi:UDP-N-acetylglucosamine 2-epimerase (non-hydrolysing)/GDP/UDP-N,N'-diacetylbacillosamine 2-epimerase (hydrolysing)
MSTRLQRVCVVTGSRSEYGLLYWVLRDLQAAADVELQLVVTGMHLAPEFGLTVREIEADGFAISRRVEMLLSSDTASGIAKSIGLGVIGMSDALVELAPDVVLLPGDRFEILAAAQACLVHRIAVAHLAGGDTSEGAFDESIRHAITKMAHVHLVTTELAAQRVRQLGEDPRHIHMVGSPGLDHLRRAPLLDRTALEAALGAPLGPRNLLVTFHPVTLEPDAGMQQFIEMLAALDALESDVTLWFTQSNADNSGREMAALLGRWVAARPQRARLHASLGQVRYLSLMSQVDAVVGNSSSGLYEAPSFAIPSVNIGNRQRGRLAAPSVIHCSPERAAIGAALAHALTLDCSGVVNPYGDGNSAARIVQVLRALGSSTELLNKSFHSLEGSS